MDAYLYLSSRAADVITQWKNSDYDMLAFRMACVLDNSKPHSIDNIEYRDILFNPLSMTLLRSDKVAPIYYAEDNAFFKDKEDLLNFITKYHSNIGQHSFATLLKLTMEVTKVYDYYRCTDTILVTGIEEVRATPTLVNNAFGIRQAGLTFVEPHNLYLLTDIEPLSKKIDYPLFRPKPYGTASSQTSIFNKEPHTSHMGLIASTSNKSWSNGPQQ